MAHHRKGSTREPPEQSGQRESQVTRLLVERQGILACLHSYRHGLGAQCVLLDRVNIASQIIHPPRVCLTEPSTQLRVRESSPRDIHIFDDARYLSLSERFLRFINCARNCRRPRSGVIGEYVFPPRLQVPIQPRRAAKRKCYRSELDLTENARFEPEERLLVVAAPLPVRPLSGRARPIARGELRKESVRRGGLRRRRCVGRYVELPSFSCR